MNPRELKAYGILAVVAFLAVFVVIPLVTQEKPKIVDPNTIVLTSSNTLILNTEVDGDSEASVLNKAKELDGGTEPLFLYLQTPGGSVQSGEEMIEALTGLGRPVHTITAFAASMGFHLAQNLGTRFILRSGVLMSHRASGGVQGQFGGQEPSQMQSRYNLMQRQMKEMDLQVVKRTKGKQTMASYQKAFDNELYVTGEEAVEQGYADKVIKVKCDKSLAGTTEFNATIMGFKIAYDLDNCPINSSPQNIRIAMNTTKGYMTEEKFIKAGGAYGIACVQASVSDKDKLCALDAGVTPETLANVRKTFLTTFAKNRSNVIPMGL